MEWESEDGKSEEVGEEEEDGKEEDDGEEEEDAFLNHTGSYTMR